MSETPQPPADPTHDTPRARTFPCESCGADLEFNIGVQQLKCPFCGFEKEIPLADNAQVLEQDLLSILSSQAALKKQGPSPLPESREVHCRACGGTVLFTSSTISTLT